MKAAKWRDLSEDELTQKARDLSEEIFNLRFQLSMGVAKNPSRLSQARRDLARAYTISKERGAVRHLAVVRTAHGLAERQRFASLGHALSRPAGAQVLGGFAMEGKGPVEPLIWLRDRQGRDGEDQGDQHQQDAG